MKLSLSVRIVEAPCKTKLNLPVESIVEVARETGYSAICMRASAGGIGTPIRRLEEIRAIVEDAGLFVAMVTADSNVPLNNDAGPQSLREIGPSLDVAEALGCTLIRICMKRPDDIPFAIQAARRAESRGICLAHQCHTSSLFEEVPAILQCLKQIDCSHFGIIYEPANLLLCGQSYAEDTLHQLRPFLKNVYVQNHRLSERGTDSLPTYCRGEVRFDHLDPWASGGVDFDRVCRALQHIDYSGTVTIHQAQGITSISQARDFAKRCADFFLPRIG